MERTCCITGENLNEHQGIAWKNLRPSVQEFLKNLKGDMSDDSFISYTALNNLMRAYITNLSSDEIKSHQALAKKIQDRYEHDEILKPINPVLGERQTTFGERLADKIADFGGSWKFIIIFLSFLLVWMAFNTFVLGKNGFDPYPYILLNLMLSCLAALQAPVIMMSQNRTESKDRERNEYDFKVNLKAEIEIRLLHEKIDHLLVHQHQNMVELLQLQLDIMQQMQNRLEQTNQQNGRDH